MIPEIDTSSVVDETESAKVTTESQMADSVRDVVIAAKPKHQTSRSVEDRLELSL